ncbi:MAG: transposase [Deltaproteobacteria bacterium]|nr:transposase [Deltaproteobacteria bacterium]
MTGTPSTRFDGSWALINPGERERRGMFLAARQSLRTGRFWHGSYCLVSVGGVPLEALRRHIENQRH